MILHFLLGFILGLIREFGVIHYTKSVIVRHKVRGSSISLGIGLLDLFIVAKLAWEKQIPMAIGYVVGETVGAYLGI